MGVNLTSVHGSEEEQQTHPPVTRKIVGAAPIRVAIIRHIQQTLADSQQISIYFGNKSSFLIYVSCFYAPVVEWKTR